MDADLKAAIKLLRKAGWSVEPPESSDVHAPEIKIKVGRDEPANLTPEQIHASFRLGGRTGEAYNYPLSARAYKWLCAFNGAKPGETPWTWRYAANPWMQAYNDRRAESEGFTN
ncbi:hypothetical protein DOMOVOI_02080 [Brevundimonas phage vB_BpoS-Domovoi]|uniref:Uncharacterized protein n=1 Tax=Brevundimonas phage vB_BpoS-Domovoi TaxID=2948598 RepID=A0A9E7SMB8_9CAUD|nr:hypothetical protein DOMOVOI_02080 [Brevundimonas phage vB_BpoS-Domovoi]